MNENEKLVFFRMEYDELIKYLGAKKTTILYKTLTSLALKELKTDAILPLKKIAESSTTMKNRKLAFKIIQNNFPEYIDELDFKRFSKIGYVYFIKEKLTNTIKIGRSQNLERRLRMFIADFPFKIELIHYIKTDNYEQIELEFHKFFKRKRVNGEWFKLEIEEVIKIKANIFPDSIRALIKLPAK